VKRVAVVLALLVALIVVVGLAVVARQGSHPYQVRAIFDNAGFVIGGEDVRIAGVTVGKIESLDVTPDAKAAVVMDITQPGYQDFRQDASCRIRPQSLIGERFIDCQPTEAHAVGQPPPPPLKTIRSGPGKGQHVLPVQNTSTTVDIDLIGDIMREPQRQRLSLILNELGTGVAGRGKDLNDVIRRANPALKETDEVLKILAAQNRVLEQLAVNSDTVLAPLARERTHVAGAIRNASAVAEATAEKRGALEADIQRLPPFLRELRPTMQRLGALSAQMTPVLADAHAQAPNINEVIEDLGPFSQAAIPAVDSLGKASKAGIPAVQDARPVIGDLRKLAGAVRPVGRTGAQVLQSVQKTQGIERLMDYVFYQVAAINGFDSVGHYLRAGLIVNQCAVYSVRPVGGCSANFDTTGSAASASLASAAPSDPVLARTARVLAHALGQQVRQAKATGKRHAKHRPARKRKAHARHRRHLEAAKRPLARPGHGTAPTAPANAAPAATASPAPTPTPAPQQAGGGDPAQDLLDYLFGKGP
jgi:phospholipid/cholesterol/gamma-HCH transport system substrate-binding protein